MANVCHLTEIDRGCVKKLMATVNVSDAGEADAEKTRLSVLSWEETGFQALIAAISGAIPRIRIARFIL